MNTFTPSVLTAIGSFNAINSGGAVTVLAAPTSVLQINLGLLNVGQLLIATCFAQIDKGAAIGDTQVLLTKNSGTGVVDWGGFGATIAQKLPAQAASTQWQCVHTAVGRCTTAGTYIAEMLAASAGVNSNIVINGASMRILQILR